LKITCVLKAADDEEETLVQTDSIATRKVLGRCWLVINEFKFGSPDTEYIELYKACPRDASLTDRRLRNVVGYYLLGATNQGIEFFEEVGHRGKAFMAPRLLNDIGQNEMYFLIGSKDVPGVTLSPAAIGGRSTIFSTSTNSPNMILLLYFPARTTRKELEKLQPIQKGIFKRLALTPERVSIIKTGLQDGIIYGTHDGTDPFSEIMTSYVITKGIYVLQTQSDSQQQGMSISRCGSEARFDVASWKYSSPTPMLPNSCISGIPFIISLKSLPSLTYPHQMGGVPLQHSAQQLVRNARYFFESAQTNPVLLQGTPSELVCRVLNLSPKTLLNLSSRKVIETPGKVRQVKSHAIDKIDCFDRDLIKRIILGHYKNNRPPFLMDIYRDFITKSKNTEISRYDGVTDSPSQQNEAFAIDEEEDLCQRSSVQSTPTRDKSPEPAAIPEAVSTPRRPKPLISVQSFRKLLHSMGLKYGRVNERMAIVQRTDVVAWRRKYLRALRKNRDDSNPREVFYLDETWLDQNVRFGRGWVPKYCESFKLFKDYSCAKTKIGKGPRLVVIGIASDKRGLIKELTKVFPITASKSQDDYHSNVDGELFTKYITEVLEFLKAENDKKPAEDRRGAVLVMDNAPYHTIADVPKLNNRKQVIYDWLKTRIQAGDMVEPDDMDTMLKAELWQLVQKLKSKNDYYKIDKIIRDYGHQVLRLPPYQCDLVSNYELY